MTIYALVPLLSVFAYGILIAFASRHPLRRERRAFTFFLAAIGLWSLISFVVHLDFPFITQHILYGIQALILSFIFMVITYYSFIRAFVGRPGGLGVYLGAGFFTLIAVLSALGIMPQAARAEAGVIFVNQGPYIYLVAIFALSVVGAVFYYLEQHYRQLTSAVARTRTTYLIVGLGVMTSGSLTNLDETLSRYPIDQLANLVNALIISYAIQRHQLLDMKFVIRHGLTYTGLSVFLTAIYLLVLFVLQVTLQGRMGYTNLIVAAGLALVMAAFFTPLRNLAQERVDRLFFRDTYAFRKILRDFSQHATSVLDLQQLTRGMLQPILPALRARWVALLFYDETNGDYRAYHVLSDFAQGKPQELRLKGDSPVVTWLTREEKPLHVEQLQVLPEAKGLWHEEREELEAWGTDLLCPLSNRGNLIAILALGRKSTEAPYNAEETDLLMTLASGASVAIENARMLESLRQHQSRHEKLLSQLVNAQEKERSRIALDLHDSVGQWLVRASYQAQICSALYVRSNGGNLENELTSVENTVDSSLKELRRVLAGLRPPALEELGLAHAVRQDLDALEREGMMCHCDIAGQEIRLPPDVEITAYRIIQEALNNVRKHSKASQVSVRLDFRKDDLLIKIADNGQGFNIPQIVDGAAAGHLGLWGMQERTEWLGGKIKFSSRKQKGTTILVSLPLPSSVPT